jgi:hypothetical protein
MLIILTIQQKKKQIIGRRRFKETMFHGSLKCGADGVIESACVIVGPEASDSLRGGGAVE